MIAPVLESTVTFVCLLSFLANVVFLAPSLGAGTVPCSPFLVNVGGSI